MALWGKLMGEFVDVITWLDDSNDTMVYRFERYGNEIKHGAKLTVREGQVAVFVNEGQIADVFQPGMYELLTANLPILSTLQAWPHGFQSPFKAEVYFFSTRRFTDLKWGTKNPIMMRDPEFGPVRLRAFGTYVIRIADPAVFLREIVGTDGQFTTDEITNQIRNQITSKFATVAGSSGIPVLDLAANYDKLGEFLTNRIAPEVKLLGLELSQMLVENISLPPEVEAAMDRRTSMGVVGDLGRYAQFQAAESMRAAAENPSGTAGAGIGMGAGFAMANQMGQMFQPGGVAPPAGQAPLPAAAPPPLPDAKPIWHLAEGGKSVGPLPLAELRQRAGSGALTRDTLVWTDGMPAWAKAGEVAALQPIFGSVPPPLPAA
jgi:membrane protease subunit (stomatin/prohibitin family)